MTFTYRQMKPDERRKFKEFHNNLFPNTNISNEWIDWYFNRVTLGKTRVHAAFDGETLIGTWCVEPKSLITDHGSVFNVGRCFAVGTHPSYRRNGLFVELSKHAIDSEKTLVEFDYIIGFPQTGKPVIGGHLKAGWDHVQHIAMKSFEVEKPKRLVSLADIKIISDFRGEFRRLHNNVGGFINDADYLNERWIKHPDLHYINLRYEEAFIVLKPYASACHVLDIYGSYEQVRYLLDAAKTLAWRHHWKELTIWCADNDYHVADVRNSDFTDGATCGLSVEMLAIRINASAPLKKFELSRWSMGSEECY